MMLGRLLGMTLLVLSLLMASGEGVMALGTGAYDVLATGEVWTLLSGQPASEAAEMESWVHNLLEMPAWTLAATCGLLLCFAYRKRAPKRRAFCRSPHFH